MTLSKTLRNVPMLLAAGLLLNTFSLPAQARTINSPKYNSRLIDGCPINMQCNSQGINYVANKYCRLIGYRRATYWTTQRRSRMRRKHRVYRLEYRPAGSIWIARRGRYYFKRIDCSF